MAKQFLLLQARPEDVAADDEYQAFLKSGGLTPEQVHRIRLDKQRLLADLDLGDYSGVIVGGGPYCVSTTDKSAEQVAVENDLHMVLDKVVERDFPYFGACYGLGILASHLGGEVSKKAYGEPLGAITVTVNEAGQRDPVLQGLPTNFRAFVGHKEAVQSVPPHSVVLATSTVCPIQMIRAGRHMYATQFHPELDRKGLILRIQVYKHAGYFPPEEAETLIAAARQETITTPAQVFKQFIDTYKR